MGKMSAHGAARRALVDTLQVQFADDVRELSLPEHADLEWATYEAEACFHLLRNHQKRVLSETTTEIQWEQNVVILRYFRPFFDKRLGGPRLYEKPGDFALQLPPCVGAEKTLVMDSEETFRETIEDLPWTASTHYKHLVVFLRELLLAGDPSAVHDGAHGMWELGFAAATSELDLPTSCVAALIDVLEVKERTWPTLSVDVERQRKQHVRVLDHHSQHSREAKHGNHSDKIEASIEGQYRGALSRIKGKLHISDAAPNTITPSEMLQGLLRGSPTHEIPPMWGATVTHAVHAVWALAARSLARKQLVDMGAHRNVLAVLASLVLANDASLKGKTTKQLALERAHSQANVKDTAATERHLRLEAGCLGALGLLLIDAHARVDMEDVFVPGLLPVEEVPATPDGTPKLVAGPVTKTSRLEKLRQMDPDQQAGTGWMLVCRLVINSVGHVEDYSVGNGVAGARVIINALARGSMERRVFQELGGLAMLSKMMTSTKGEVQKCAMVGLSMFPDGEGLRKYLEQQDSETMRREAAPVFHILCRVMLRRVCIVAGLHRNVWADRVLRHVMDVDRVKQAMEQSTIPLWHAARALIVASSFEEPEARYLLELIGPCTLRPKPIGGETLLTLCRICFHASTSSGVPSHLLDLGAMQTFQRLFVESDTDSRVRVVCMGTLLSLMQASMPGPETHALHKFCPTEEELAVGSVVEFPMKVTLAHCSRLKEDGAEEIIFQAMATMRDIAMNSSKQIDVGQGSRLQAQKDFLELSLASLTCLAMSDSKEASVEAVVHAVYALCSSTGECRVYAACNVYFLARHASNRQSLGKAGAVEALVLLLHESMQGKRPTDPEDSARRASRGCAEERLSEWVHHDAPMAALDVTAKVAARCFGELDHVDQESGLPNSTSQPSPPPASSVPTNCISERFQEENTSRMAEEWMALALWLLLLEPDNLTVLLIPRMVPLDTKDPYADMDDVTQTTLCRALLQLIAWTQSETVTSPSLDTVHRFLLSAMHTAFSASDEVFDMAIHLRAPHRLMELMESASTSPARCAHAMQLVLLLLSRPPQPPTTSAPPQSFIDSNAPSVQTSGAGSSAVPLVKPMMMDLCPDQAPQKWRRRSSVEMQRAIEERKLHEASIKAQSQTQGNEAGPCEHADDGASDRSVQEQECSAKESSTAPENTRTPQQPKSTKPLAILVPSSPRAGMGLTTNKSARKPSAPVARSFNLSQGAATPEPKMQTSGGVAGGAMSTPRSVLREMRRRERGAALRAACIAILLAKRRGGAESRRSQVRASPDGSESSSSQHSHSTPEPPPKPQPVSKPMWKAPFSLKAAHAESVKLLHDGKLETMVTACMRSRHRQLRLVAVKAVAFLAHEHRRKVMIEERGAIDELARVAVECCKAPDGKGFRPWGVTGENTKSKQDTELLETAVTALLNLSTISKNQVTVCKQSVELLMELVGLDGTLDTSEVGYTIRQLARDILHNLALNKANITELYKMELKWKAQLATSTGTPSWLVEEPHSPPRTPVTPLGGQPRGRLNVLAQRVFAKKTVQDLLSGSAPVDARERCRQQRRRFHNWLTENFDGESAATSPRSATPPHARGNAQAVKWEGQASPKCSSQWFEDVRREGAGVQLLRSLRTPMSSMWDSLGDVDSKAEPQARVPVMQVGLTDTDPHPMLRLASKVEPSAPKCPNKNNDSKTSQASRPTSGTGPRRGAHLTHRPSSTNNLGDVTARRAQTCRRHRKAKATAGEGGDEWKPVVHKVVRTPRSQLRLKSQAGSAPAQAGGGAVQAGVESSRSSSKINGALDKMDDIALDKSRASMQRPAGVPTLELGALASGAANEHSTLASSHAQSAPHPPPAASKLSPKKRFAGSNAPGDKQSHPPGSAAAKPRKTWSSGRTFTNPHYPPPPMHIPQLQHLLLPRRPPHRALHEPGAEVARSKPTRPVSATRRSGKTLDPQLGYKGPDTTCMLVHHKSTELGPCECRWCRMAASGMDAATTVELNPPKARNVFHFIEGNVPLVRGNNTLDLFKHLEGCQYCTGLYDHFELPTGELVHYYRPTTLVKDEVPVPLNDPPPPPLNFAEACIQLPCLPSSVVALQRTSPVQVLHYRPVPHMPPRPSKHFLAVVNHECGSGRDASQCAFHGVLEPKRHRFLLEEGVERKIEYKHGAREPWSIERSIFAARKRESCAFYDTQRMINRMFDTDWARLAGKTLFRRNMIRGSKGLDNLKNSLRGVYNTILHAFDFYCAGDGNYNMGLGEFLDVCNDCKITDRAACKISDLTNIFNLANAEGDDGDEDDNKYNDDSSLHRFEFMDALCRIGFEKFKREKWPTHIALENLVVDIIEPNLPRAATVIPNDFRQLRLYTLEVDRVFRKHEKFLQVVHDIYSDEDTRITFDEVQPLLEDSGLLASVESSESNGIMLDFEDAAVAFSLSRLQMSDELRYQDRLTSLSFVDFLEYLARIADAVSPPTREDLVAIGCASGTMREYLQGIKDGTIVVRIERRNSGGVSGTPTRYLHEKLEQIIVMMLDALCFKFKVPMSRNMEEHLIVELKRHKFSMNAKQASLEYQRSLGFSDRTPPGTPGRSRGPGTPSSARRRRKPSLQRGSPSGSPIRRMPQEA